jgi:hypothetical protein
VSRDVEALFDQPSVRAYASKAVFVRVDVSHLSPRSTAAAILRELSIEGFPAVAVFDVKEDELFPAGLSTATTKGSRPRSESTVS